LYKENSCCSLRGVQRGHSPACKREGSSKPLRVQLLLAGHTAAACRRGATRHGPVCYAGPHCCLFHRRLHAVASQLELLCGLPLPTQASATPTVLQNQPATCSNLSFSNSPGGSLVPCAQPRLLCRLRPQNHRHAVMQPLQPLAGICGKSVVTEECRIWSAGRSDRGACWVRQPCLQRGSSVCAMAGMDTQTARQHVRRCIVLGEKAACHAQRNTSARTGPSDRKTTAGKRAMPPFRHLSRRSAHSSTGTCCENGVGMHGALWCIPDVPQPSKDHWLFARLLPRLLRLLLAAAAAAAACAAAVCGVIYHRRQVHVVGLQHMWDSGMQSVAD